MTSTMAGQHGEQPLEHVEDEGVLGQEYPWEDVNDKRVRVRFNIVPDYDNTMTKEMAPSWTTTYYDGT